MMAKTMSIVFIISFLSIFVTQNDAFCDKTSRLHFGRLARSSMRAAEFVRGKLMNKKTSIQGHHLGVTLHSLRLAGYSLDMLSRLTLGKQRFEEIVRQLNTSEITPAEAGYYLYGSLAICQDPKDYSHLVQRIKDGIPSYPTIINNRPFNHPFQYSLAVLALCMSGNGQELFSGYAVKLKSLISRSGNLIHAGDTTGLLSMALACIYKDGKLKNDQTIQQTLELSANFFISAQRNGSFGNSITTAIAVQTLLTFKETAGLNIDMTKWNCTDTVDFLLSKQAKDGSFQTYLMSVTQVLPALTGAIPGDASHITCPVKTIPQEPKKIEVCVRLEFHTSVKNGTTPTSPVPVYLTVDNGTNAHTILLLAAKINPCYKLTATLGAYGHSVVSICGVSKDRPNKKYWMIYTGPMAANGQDKSARTGIDSFRPKHKTCVIFKYKKLNF